MPALVQIAVTESKQKAGSIVKNKEKQEPGYKFVVKKEVRYVVYRDMRGYN